MKSVPIDSGMFTQHREKLKGMLPPGSLAVICSNDVMPTNADGTMGFHQNADLFYLTGINQEETVLVLFPDAFDEKTREILFVRQSSELLEIWEGHKVTKAEATAISGIKEIRWVSDLPAALHRLMSECKQVYLNGNEYPSGSRDVETRELRFARALRHQYPLHKVERLAPILSALRLVKSSGELELIRKACGITRAGFLRSLQFIKPGVNEAEIEAEWAHEFIRQKATFAYPPIICSGANNCILHYNANDQVCKKGELVLMDVGAGYGQYASDLTRTVPVSGKFSRRQKQVYNAVLRVFKKIVAAMKPGVTLKELRTMCEKLTEEELLSLELLKPSDVKKQDPANPAFKKYFMHGVSHSMGLDVHDVGAVSATLAPGWVVTCEPAIYIKEEGFGVRIENDILITDSEPIDLMADIPVEVDEIESLMRDE